VFTARYVLHSTFCPHSVFMCFVWIWEQTAIISLYSINWLQSATHHRTVQNKTHSTPILHRHTPPSITNTRKSSKKNHPTLTSRRLTKPPLVERTKFFTTTYASSTTTKQIQKTTNLKFQILRLPIISNNHNINTAFSTTVQNNIHTSTTYHRPT
jgi:hypothetical protein